MTACSTLTHLPLPTGQRSLVALALAASLWGPAAQAQTKPAEAATSSPTSSPTSSGASDAMKVGTTVTSNSGLVFKLMKAGAGPSPSATDTVKVHYRGTLADGKEFDSSYSRGSPAEFPLNRVIKCWTEGVQKLQVGGAARLTCPPAIAYGERGAGGVIPPNATLTFDVELLGISGR